MIPQNLLMNQDNTKIAGQKIQIVAISFQISKYRTMGISDYVMV